MWDIDKLCNTSPQLQSNNTTQNAAARSSKDHEFSFIAEKGTTFVRKSLFLLFHECDLVLNDGTQLSDAAALGDDAEDLVFPLAGPPGTGQGSHLGILPALGEHGGGRTHHGDLAGVAAHVQQAVNASVDGGRAGDDHLGALGQQLRLAVHAADMDVAFIEGNAFVEHVELLDLLGKNLGHGLDEADHAHGVLGSDVHAVVALFINIISNVQLLGGCRQNSAADGPGDVIPALHGPFRHIPGGHAHRTGGIAEGGALRGQAVAQDVGDAHGLITQLDGDEGDANRQIPDGQALQIGLGGFQDRILYRSVFQINSPLFPDTEHR